MDTRLHLHVTAGFAVLSVGAAVAVPAVSPAVARPVQSDAVALVAQAEPLSPTPTATTLSPPGLIGQQVAFHVVFVTDFLLTGAQLFARELPIPLTLAADLGAGTPLPTAVARALQYLAAVEVDAGNELLRFGAEYIGFQAQLVTSLIPSQAAVAPTATPAPRTVVESAPPARTPTTIALTHRSKPRDEASPTVPSKPERPVYGNYIPALIVIALLMITVNFALGSFATWLEGRMRRSRRGPEPMHIQPVTQGTFNAGGGGTI